MNPSIPVLIVGAGPTGLLLAAELCRRNVGCRLIDANPAPLGWDRATVVHPRSLEVFESLGLVEQFLSAGVKQRMARIHADGSVIGEVNLSNCGSCYGFNIGISEEVTEKILTEYLHQQGGEVVRSSKLVDLAEHADHIVATIDHDGTTERITANWVVGCDGIHSTTRNNTGIELTGHDIEQPWAVFDATIPNWSQSYEANYVYLDDTSVILTALPGKRWRIYMRPSSAESDLVADATNSLVRYLPGIRFEEVTSSSRFHCHNKVASRYPAGRILLAGDAAHVCSPIEGHGMNSGIQDAFNLAWKLALVCQGHSDATLLDSYEAERRPVAEMITASGDSAESVHNVADGKERRRRDKSVREALSDPASLHHEVIAEAELDIDYCSSPIVHGDKHKMFAPSHRLCSTIEMEHANGKRCKLHELTHRSGHTAILVGGPSATAEQVAGLAQEIQRQNDLKFIDETVALSTQTDATESFARLEATAAELLGVQELTLLVIRPDGHIGLRADRDHIATLADYCTLLKSC